jgi:hypothetical protein
VTTIVFESVDPQSDDEDRDSIHAATPTPVWIDENPPSLGEQCYNNKPTSSIEYKSYD